MHFICKQTNYLYWLNCRRFSRMKVPEKPFYYHQSFECGQIFVARFPLHSSSEWRRQCEMSTVFTSRRKNAVHRFNNISQKLAQHERNEGISHKVTKTALKMQYISSNNNNHTFIFSRSFSFLLSGLRLNTIFRHFYSRQFCHFLCVHFVDCEFLWPFI